jgi:hypothetical protein
MARLLAAGACAFTLTGVEGTGAPTPSPPAPATPNTPAPTYSTDDAQAHYVDFAAHCELNLNYDECHTFALDQGLDFQSAPEANQGLPSGCFRQYPDAVLVFNQQPNFNFIALGEGTPLCPMDYFNGNYIECYLKMVCREPDFDQMDEGEVCGENQGLTLSECEAIGEAHAGSSGFAWTLSYDDFAKGCLLDTEDHQVYFNSHPTGSALNTRANMRLLCSQDMGPTDAPTPEPTPMPTPTPTITPTWSEELQTFMADWGHGCELNLNKEECENWAMKRMAEFQTRNEGGLPRGCWQQHPDEVVIFNSYDMWSPAEEALEQWCNPDPFHTDKPCYARMICRKPDWFVQDGPCQAGTSLNERQCGRIGNAHDHYGGNYVALTSKFLPTGCFGKRMDGEEKVVFNRHSAGSGRDQGATGFCKEPAHPCAHKEDGLARNRWYQKRCHKSRKKTCNARCDRKCIDTCKCNVKCADSTTWYFNEFMDMEEHWYNERNCAWVEQNPDERCKVDGMDGDKKVRANAACPTACGKCKSEDRRLSSKTTLV